MQQLKSKVFQRLWPGEPTKITPLKGLLDFPRKATVMVGRDFIENFVKLQAMALAFKTLLSLAPLLAVVFSILKGFGAHNRIEPALTEALAPLGEKGQEITSHLIEFVDKMSASALGSVGFVTLFITVISLLGTIEQAFNSIWHVKAPRKLARKFSDYLSVILVGPVLIFAAVTITATLQSNTFVQNLLAFEPFGTVLLTLLRFLPYLTLWGAFTFFYLFIPNTRVRLRSALIGGLVAAVLWQTVGWGFAKFVASSTHYYAIYSSFAILLLFLLWLHIGWVIILLGAQVSHAHQHLRFYYANRESLAHSAVGRQKLALETILLIGRNFFNGLKPLDITELSSRLQIPAALVKDFVEMFRHRRLLLTLAEEETFVLGRAPEQITLKEIFDCVANHGGEGQLAAFPGADETGVDKILSEIDQAVTEKLQGKTLRSLIVSHDLEGGVAAKR